VHRFIIRHTIEEKVENVYRIRRELGWQARATRKGIVNDDVTNVEELAHLLDMQVREEDTQQHEPQAQSNEAVAAAAAAAGVSV
jgi:hypothetical protein